MPNLDLRMNKKFDTICVMKPILNKKGNCFLKLYSDITTYFFVLFKAKRFFYVIERLEPFSI